MFIAANVAFPIGFATDLYRLTNANRGWIIGCFVVMDILWILHFVFYVKTGVNDKVGMKRQLISSGLLLVLGVCMRVAISGALTSLERATTMATIVTIYSNYLIGYMVVSVCLTGIVLYILSCNTHPY